MALFSFNSRRYEMLMNAVYLSTQFDALQIAFTILIVRPTYQLVNDIRARIGKACVRVCTPLQAFISHETDANSELQRYTAELHFRHRVSCSSGWIAFLSTRDSAGTGSCGVSRL